ncbi:MAG: ankyrin repeat domain-containing protein [Legionella sp.]|nr:ankyrin repeat domain-containing protein [Legionella sp.]
MSYYYSPYEQSKRKMPEIYFDPRHVQEDDLKPLQEALWKILNNTHTQTKILQGVRYKAEIVYRAKLNDKHRLIYCWMGEPRQLMILRLLVSHKYEQVHRQLGGEITRVEKLTLADESVEVNQDGLVLQAMPKSYYSQRELILWDKYQQQALELKMPLLLSGPPGSGKSAVLLELLHQYTPIFPELPVLFLSQSQSLVEQMQRFYEEDCPSGMNYKKVQFMTWEQLLQNAYPEYRRVASDAFSSWLAKHDKTLNVSISYYELSLIAALGINNYRALSLGKRQSYYSDDEKQRDQHINLLQVWQHVLETNKFYDPVVTPLPDSMNTKYAGVFCDELQNLPAVAISSIIARTQAQHIVANMDPHQCLISSPFIDSCFKMLVQQHWQCSLYEHLLPRTWRSRAAIVAAGNQLMQFKFSIEGKGVRRAYSALESAQILPGLISWIMPTHIGELGRYHQDDTALIVLNPEDPALIPLKALGFHYILTPEQAIGLEFRTVILVHFVSHLWDQLKQKKEQNGLTIGEMTALNKTFVALSRGMNQVFIVEPHNKAMREWAHKVLGLIPDNQTVELTALQQLSPEQLLTRVEHHLNEGQQEPAEAILRHYLRYTDVEIAAYIEKRRDKAEKNRVVLSETEPTAQSLPKDKPEPKVGRNQKNGSEPKVGDSQKNPRAAKTLQPLTIKSNVGTIDAAQIQKQTGLKVIMANQPSEKQTPPIYKFLREIAEDPSKLPMLIASTKLTEFLFEAPVYEHETLFSRLMNAKFASTFLILLLEKKDVLSNYLLSPDSVSGPKPVKSEQMKSFRSIEEFKKYHLMKLCHSMEGLNLLETLFQCSNLGNSDVFFKPLKSNNTLYSDTTLYYWLSFTERGQQLLLQLIQKSSKIKDYISKTIFEIDDPFNTIALENLTTSTIGVTLIRFMKPGFSSVRWDAIGTVSWVGERSDFVDFFRKMVSLFVTENLRLQQKVSFEISWESNFLYCVFVDNQFDLHGLFNGKTDSSWEDTEQLIEKLASSIFNNYASTQKVKISILKINPGKEILSEQSPAEIFQKNYSGMIEPFPLEGVDLTNPEQQQKLFHKKLLVSERTMDNKNFLHIAVLHSCIDFIKLYPIHESWFNAQDQSGMTPLNLAAFIKRPDLASLMLDFNADPNIVDNIGRSPLHYAVNSRAYELVEKLLSHKNIDLNKVDNKNISAFCIANDIGDAKLIFMFLAKGVNVNRTIFERITPAAQAAYANNEKLFDSLMDKGADIQSRMKEGVTPGALILSQISLKQIDYKWIQKLFYKRIDLGITSLILQKEHTLVELAYQRKERFIGRAIKEYMSIFYPHHKELHAHNNTVKLTEISKIYLDKKVVDNKLLCEFVADAQDDEINQAVINYFSSFITHLRRPNPDINLLIYWLVNKNNKDFLLKYLSDPLNNLYIRLSTLTEKVTDPEHLFYGTSMLFWFCYLENNSFHLSTLLKNRPQLKKGLKSCLARKEELFHIPLSPIQMLLSHEDGRSLLNSQFPDLLNFVFDKFAVFDLVSLERFINAFLTAIEDVPEEGKPVIYFKIGRKVATGIILNSGEWFLRTSGLGRKSIVCANLSSFINELEFLKHLDGFYHVHVNVVVPVKKACHSLIENLKIEHLTGSGIDYKFLCQQLLRMWDLRAMEQLFRELGSNLKKFLEDSGDYLVQYAITRDFSEGIICLWNYMVDCGIDVLSTPPRNILACAVKTFNEDLIKKMLDLGFKINEPFFTDSLLFRAINENSLEQLKTLAVLNPNLDSALDFEGNTALILAARSNNNDFFHRLMDMGADLSKVNDEGISPIFWLIVNNNDFCIERLSTRGVEMPPAIQIPNGGKLPIDISLLKQYNIANAPEIANNLKKLFDKKINSNPVIITALELARIVGNRKLNEGVNFKFFTRKTDKEGPEEKNKQQPKNK